MNENKISQMNAFEIPGSKWWKFDFHSHTPKSDDYPDKSVTAGQWLLEFMKHGMDAVVVTDHNSGEWIDILKEELKNLRISDPLKFRELVIFPGVELAVNGGTHVLIILDPSKSNSDVGGIIRACGYTGTWGQSSGRGNMSLNQVLDTAQQHNALVIPAHVDKSNGLWEISDFGSQTNDLNHRELFAIERISKTSQPSNASVNIRKKFAEVLGSDSHKLSEVGGRFTWVKMGNPTLEGLRLALLDGNESLRRSDESSSNPNDAQSSRIIEQFEVTKAQFIGRPSTFKVEFNPWMNTFIGGRGTGKSSLLEFIRITLSREKELDAFSDLSKEFHKKYMTKWAGRAAGGLQTSETEFRLIYRKDGQRYRITYNGTSSQSSIEEEDESNIWKMSVGDVESRFPVRIYSQKQIYELADNPSALLEIIDQDPLVAKNDWDLSWASERNNYRSLMVKIRELNIALGAESRLRGELDDVNRKLKVLENEGNQETLKIFQKTQNQSGYVEEWGDELKIIPQSIREFANGIGISEFASSSFDSDTDAELLVAAKAASDKIAELVVDLEAIAKKADLAVKTWNDFQNNSNWKKRVCSSKTAYDEVVRQLVDQGVEDPGEFKLRISERHQLDHQLKEIDTKKAELAKLKNQQISALEQMFKLRQKLSNDRSTFLRNVLKGAKHVQIDVVCFGNIESAVDGYRNIIRRDGGLDEDILDEKAQSGILMPLYDTESKRPVADFLAQFEKIKKKTRSIIGGSEPDANGFGAWFIRHLTTKVSEEDLDDLDIWFPEDSLEMKYRPREGESFRPISQGSPGQKTAALLAFLLSYGTEPILLDQPEDDLDNQLIFNLVARQLIANKARRQVIVVTHNANIVVNGDAELVLALESKNGQTTYQAKGGLQDAMVRQTICDVMEGGEEAFELRYRRIKEGLQWGARTADRS